MQLLPILEKFVRLLGDVPGDLAFCGSCELPVLLKLAVARRRFWGFYHGLLDVFGYSRAPLLRVKGLDFPVDLLQSGPDAI